MEILRHRDRAPAPVPPEVAIPRPTPADIQQVNDVVKRLIAADTSSVKPLLTKYQSLMYVSRPA